MNKFARERLDGTLAELRAATSPTEKTQLERVVVLDLQLDPTIDRQILNIKESVRLLVQAGYPASRVQLRNVICRGKGPPQVETPLDGRSPVSFRLGDVLRWAAKRVWVERRRNTLRPVLPEDALTRVAVYDQILLLIRNENPKLFDRVSKIAGPRRREVLQQIAVNAIDLAEHECIEFVEREG